MLTAGQRLGHFEVLGPIGQGGMGEVWRARDVQLGRDVAFKVLPPGSPRTPSVWPAFSVKRRSWPR